MSEKEKRPADQAERDDGAFVPGKPDNRKVYTERDKTARCSVTRSPVPNTTARLLQMYYSFARCGEVLLTIHTEADLGGKPTVSKVARPEDGIAYSDREAARRFILGKTAAGVVIGMGWNPDEEHVYHDLFRYAALLDEYGRAEVLIVSPQGGEVTEIALDDLEHAAGVLGYASLFGYSLLLSVEGGGDE